MAYRFIPGPYTALLQVFNEEIAYHGLTVTDGWVRIAETSSGRPGFCLKLLDVVTVNFLQRVGKVVFRETKAPGDDTIRRTDRVRILERYSRVFFDIPGEYVTYRVSSHDGMDAAYTPPYVIARPDGVGHFFQKPAAGVVFSGPGCDLKPYTP